MVDSQHFQTKKIRLITNTGRDSSGIKISTLTPVSGNSGCKTRSSAVVAKLTSKVAGIIKIRKRSGI